MRGLAVILVLSAVGFCSSLRIADLPICPPEDPTLPPAYFPNPDDNTTFYECSWGVPILTHCPDGLFWDQSLETCNYHAENGTSPNPVITSTPGTTAGVTTSNPETTVDVTTPVPPLSCPNGPDEVLLPNPEDCGTFFKCDHGKPVLQYCPEGLEWNDEKKICDYPGTAKCTAIGTPTSNPSTAEIVTTTIASTTVDVTTSVPSTTEVVTTSVPSTTEVVTTSVPSTTEVVTTPSPSSTSGPVPNCPTESGPDEVLIPNPEDCGSFFICDNGVPIIQYCPDGLEWNDEKKVCDYPGTAKCTAIGTPTSNPSTTEILTSTVPSTTVVVTTPSPSSTSGPAPSCPTESGPDEVLIPNPEDCGSFFICDNGVPIIQYCPDGLEWNDEKKVCDYPGTAKCTAIVPSTTEIVTTTVPSTTEVVTTTVPSTTEVVTTSVPSTTEVVTTSVPSTTEVVTTSVPSTTVVVTTSVSSTTEVVTTSSPGTTIDVTTTSPGFNPNGCPTENGPEDVLLPNPEDCGTFFKCDHGKPVLQYCPEGLEWNDEKKVCDYPGVAKCTPTGATTSKPEHLPNGCPAVNGPNDVLLPNPLDCTTFFKCDHGIPVLQKCPVGLHWNDDKKYCDYPDVAKCQEIPVPTSIPSTTSKPEHLPNGCPAETGSDDVLLPNPMDCGSFFKCDNGIPILQQCPQGLHWNDDKKYCDYPDEANCEVIPQPTSTSKPSTKETSTTSGPATTSEESTPPSPSTTVDVTTSKPSTTVDVTTSGPGPNCPTVSGPDDVLLPNPADCGSFYICDNGVPVIQYCPDGLEWNDDKKVCDFPGAAKCSATGSTTSNPSTTVIVTTSQPSTTDIVSSPNPSTTEVGTTSIPSTTEIGTTSIPSTTEVLTTSIPSTTVVVTTSNPTSTTAAVTTSNPGTTVYVTTSSPGLNPNGCPIENGPEDVLLPNPEDCGTFFKCDHGKPVLQHCPKDLEWNDEKKVCDYPGVAKCTPTGATTSKPEHLPNGCPAVNGPNDVLLPNPLDCTTFFKCDHGIPVLQKCPVGLHWNDDKKYCDYPDVAKCQEIPVPTSIPSTTSKPEHLPNGCPAVNGPNDVLLPNPLDCSTFFKCDHGIPVLQKCPVGLHWNDDKKYCDYPDIAKCQEIPVPTSIPSTTSKPPEHLPNGCPTVNGPNDVLLPNPLDCTTFFKCDHGIPVLQKCPVGLHWNDDKKYCDYPDVAKCQEIPVPTSIPSTTSKPEHLPNGCPAETGPDDVLLPNPMDCGSFFKCDNGIPILQQCPQGLHWNDDKKYCDYPNEAKCEVIPQPTSTSATSTAGTSTTSAPLTTSQSLTTPEQSTTLSTLTTSQPTLTSEPTTSKPLTTSQSATSSEPSTTSRPLTTASGHLPNGCPAVEGSEEVMLPNPLDCSTYFQCVHGQLVERDCPQGLEWNNDKKVCDYPEVANCRATGTSTSNPGTTEISTTSNPSTTTEVVATSSPSTTTVVSTPSPSSTTIVATTSNPSTTAVVTSTTTVVATTSNPSTTVDITTSSPSPNPNSCPAVNGPEDVLLPNPADCGTFFKCDHGVPVLQYCPAGLEWNDKKKVCDYPAEAQCTATGPTTPKPEQLPNGCPAVNTPDDVLLPNPLDCNTFYICDHGIPVLQQCPQGLNWNDEKKICDYPELAKCEAIPQPTSGPTSSSPVSTPEPSTTSRPLTTSEPSITPEPSTTSRPLTTSEPSITPEPSTTSRPLTTSEPSITQEPSTTSRPLTTSEPSITQEPSTTSRPLTTSEPSITQEPSTTSRPLTTSEPSITQEPSTTSRPLTTSEPSITPEPSTTSRPLTSSEPSITQEPSTTSRPLTTSEPSITPEPSTTSRPLTSSEPSITQEPSTTSRPLTSSEPSITAEPATTSKPKPQPSDCPPEDPALPPTYLPDPDDDTIFYECSWGVPILEHCDPGLVWSQALKVCVFRTKSELNQLSLKTLLTSQR